MNHFHYLSIFLVLIIGNVMVTIFFRLNKRYAFPFFKYLTLHLLFYYLIVLIQILKIYMVVNVPQAYARIFLFILPTATALVIGLVSTYAFCLIHFYEEGPSPAKKKVMYALLFVVVGIEVIGVTLFLSGDFDFVIHTGHVYPAAMTFLSLVMILDKNISRVASDRNVIRLFGGIYLVWCLFYTYHLHVPLITSLYFYLAIQTAMFLFPLVWFKNIFLKRHSWALDCRRDRSGLNRIFRDKSITEREEEIIRLVLKGKSNREIGRELYISMYTVKNHIQNIYSKLGVRGRTKLIRLLNDSIQRAA